MILSAHNIKLLNILDPCLEKYVFEGVSGGLSHCGYDIAIDQSIIVPSHGFVLASSRERFTMPKNIVGTQHDKSTWARMGMAVQSTVIEPGWEGYLTIEISNHGPKQIVLFRGTPVAQILFHVIDQSVNGYKGKYQGQGPNPQEAIFE